MSQQDPRQLTDDVIEERVRVLQAEGFPEEDTQRLAEEIAHHRWGRRAEGALHRLVDRLPAERMGRLVSRHVMARPDSLDPRDYCGVDAEQVAEKLWDLGLPLRGDRKGWSVALPDGTEITRTNGSGGNGQGDAVCRVALLGVWLRTMRKREAALKANG